MNTPIRVVIADDHVLVRSLIKDLLVRRGEMYTVVGEAGSGEEALTLVARFRPDVLILDYRMPGVSRLSDLCQEVGRKSPATRILVLSGEGGEAAVIEAAIGGSLGYVLKGTPIAEFLNALSTVHRGGVYVDSLLPPRVCQAFVGRLKKGADKLGRLSRQELKVLCLVGHRMSNAEIGRQLYLSKKTIKNHLTHILAKLEVTDREHAATLLFAKTKSPIRQ